MKINNEYFIIKKMHFMDAVCTDGILFFFDTNMNAFFSCKIEDGLLTYLHVGNARKEIKENPRKILRYQNDFYTVQASTCIVNHYIYKDGELLFDSQIIADKFKGKVKDAFLYNDTLWIVPVEDRLSIAIIDLSIETVEYLKIAESSIRNNGFRDTTCVNNRIYISCVGNGDLCCINMVDRRIEIYTSVIPKPIEGITSKDNELFLRVKGGKELYSWDMNEKKSRLIAESNDNYEDIGKLRVLSNGNIIICPIYDNKFFYVDPDSKSIIPVKNENEIHHNNSITFTIDTEEYKGSLYVCPWAGEKIVKISFENQTYLAKGLDFKILKENYREYFRDKGMVGNIIQEGDCIQLEDYLQMI